MDTKYKVRVGRQGESFAADMLMNKGFVILARNYRCYRGEIDIIARKGREIHFVEVKTRFGSGNGYPEEAVTSTKVNNMTAVAQYYMSRLGQKQYKVVFDVMAIDVEFIENCI